MKTLILFLSLISCAPKVPHTIDKEFAPYIHTFEEISGIPVQISVIFAPMLDPMSLGECIGHVEVHIDKAYWFNPATTTDMREEIILHELGHCVLYRGHRNDYGPLGAFAGVQLSIMNEIAFGDQPWYAANKQYYYWELVHVGN